ncbi:hypothetical protein CA13_18500 [Planctomycetes bacterium CA13]|uniref:DUF1254 domain-containing protein n=1 Tax=Novipirellula herctigrandis TaxID=2527986 RepID=A0A5C5Z1G5_9BACT|nr:hypothetical protein CA13_18500 [Planctomycetes bacterium CA13]
MHQLRLLTSVAVLAGSLTVSTLPAQDEPTYKADVPDSISTPDRVSTKYVGELEFRDGFPSDQTVTNVYDYLDTSRAVQVFLSSMPAASIYGLLEGHKKIGCEANHSVGITETLMNARSLWLTPQTTTPYVHGEIDVKNGPVVVELGSPVIGLIDDAYFRYVGDLGVVGPDQGKGGKYLVVGPDFKGEIPDDYFVLKTKTYRQWLLIRIVVTGGQTQQAVEAFKKTFKIYPLADAANPKPTEFVNLSDKQYNTIHANDAGFFDEINAVIQYEPEDSYDPEIVGLAASIGIKKGQPFEPDDRMKKILKEAAAIGNAASRAILFRPRDEKVFFYPGKRQWYSPLAGGSHEFLDHGARVLDDRVAFHYYATGITPKMTQPKVGTGSVYEIGSTDSNGKALDGGRTYSVTLPAPIPAKNFWSFMVYDNQTRSILETDQKTGGLDSNSAALKLNDDGSATVYFGPQKPEGQEGNWVQTMPGKGYNVLLRLYGPLQPWFDKTWMPGDFEPVK